MSGVTLSSEWSNGLIVRRDAALASNEASQTRSCLCRHTEEHDCIHKQLGGRTGVCAPPLWSCSLGWLSSVKTAVHYLFLREGRLCVRIVKAASPLFPSSQLRASPPASSSRRPGCLLAETPPSLSCVAPGPDRVNPTVCHTEGKCAPRMT